jgi:asparagine synthase (glutamine-hydrolysing)
VALDRPRAAALMPEATATPAEPALPAVAPGPPAGGWAAAFADQGAAAPAAVRGAFAVGLHLPDGRAFAAVDRFAEHSLCWRVIGGRVHFAERADTLAALAPAAELDPQAILDYLYFHVVPAPRTVYRGVFRVPAGHCASFDAMGNVTLAPYWRPVFEAPGRPDFGALAAEFRQLLQDAVAARLDGGKAGCFLSGGTDSSTVAGMIGRVTGRPAASYSIGFEAQGYDEMAYARLAARHFGLEHHERYVTPDDVARLVPAVAAHHDQPFGNSSALPAFCCAEMARDDGVTRLQAGDGGDELFGGNARYAKQRIFGWYQAVPGPLRGALLEPLLLRTPVGRLPLLKKGASYVGQAREPMPDRMQQYNLLLRLGVAEVLEPAFLEQVDLGGPLARQREVWVQAGAKADIDRTLAFDWRYTLAEADLPKVRGAVAMAGIGVGFPMLDDTLLQFSLRLPPAYKLKGLQLRWFFKEALRGFLPDEILAKRKQGFGLPFGVWANSHAGLKGLATDSLHGLAERGIVRRSFIEALLRTHLPAHPGYYGEMVWILMMLEQWMRARAR